MTKLNCIIIHGCPSDEERAVNPQTRTYDKHWIPWLKRELELKGIKTETPLMPNPWKPNYNGFKKEFEKYVVAVQSCANKDYKKMIEFLTSIFPD